MGKVTELRETARQRRRRIAAEEEQWADEAYAEWLTTDEGGQKCYVLSVQVRWPEPDVVTGTVVAQDEEIHHG